MARFQVLQENGAISKFTHDNLVGFQRLPENCAVSTFTRKWRGIKVYTKMALFQSLHENGAGSKFTHDITYIINSL